MNEDAKALLDSGAVASALAVVDSVQRAIRSPVTRYDKSALASALCIEGRAHIEVNRIDEGVGAFEACSVFLPSMKMPHQATHWDDIAKAYGAAEQRCRQRDAYAYAAAKADTAGMEREEALWTRYAGEAARECLSSTPHRTQEGGPGWLIAGLIGLAMGILVSSWSTPTIPPSALAQ